VSQYSKENSDFEKHFEVMKIAGIECKEIFFAKIDHNSWPVCDDKKNNFVIYKTKR